MNNQTKKVWTETEIEQLLNNSDKAVIRGVIAIYERQTAEEQNIGDTKVLNGIGFNGADAKFLSYCATYAKNKGTLSGEFLNKARTRIKKYRRQLTDIANS